MLPYLCSHFGANQLRLDFTCFRDWVGHDALHLSNSTVSSILSSNAFVDFDAAITLLCCQPESRRRSNFGSDSDNSASMGSSTSQGNFSVLVDALMIYINFSMLRLNLTACAISIRVLIFIFSSSCSLIFALCAKLGIERSKIDQLTVSFDDT